MPPARNQLVWSHFVPIEKADFKIERVACKYCGHQTSAISVARAQKHLRECQAAIATNQIAPEILNPEVLESPSGLQFSPTRDMNGYSEGLPNTPTPIGMASATSMAGTTGGSGSAGQMMQGQLGQQHQLQQQQQQQFQSKQAPNLQRRQTSTTQHNLSDAEVQTLAAEATKARNRAYCPYSHFRVGASLMTTSGTFIPGANVENAAYPSGTCAERVALGTAVGGMGLRRGDFRAIGVITDLGRKTGGPASPCGMCRQALREFLDLSTPVFMFYKEEGVGVPVGFIVKTLGELLPMSFGPDVLPSPDVMDQIQGKDGTGGMGGGSGGGGGGGMFANSMVS